MPADAINTVPIDAEGSCRTLLADDSASLIKPLTNTEYSLSVADLLQTSAAAGAGLPPDATATGFDTAAARTLTTTLAESYLNASQTLAAAYVAQANVACGDQAFAPACTADAVAKLAQRAFRRPLLGEEAQRLSGLPQRFIATGLEPQQAYAASIATILMAPQFLYRSTLPAAAGLASSAQYALASKLSYALWASLPDDELLAAAAAGNLSDPALLPATLNRMLSSPKAQGFLGSFSGQWLGTRDLAQAPAAAHLDAALVADFGREASAFVADFLHNNRNVRGLLDAHFSYLNARLANYYGMTQVAGDDLAYTAVDGSQRGGLLTQGAFLLATSNPDGTSPVKRGKWILDNILCAAPPPPPVGVQTALAATSGTVLPMRQRLAAHRSATACASCHINMDPIGLAFENYDGAGKWRSKDAFGQVDASGQLASGEAFANSADLAQLLKKNPAFPECLSTKLASYLLGRVPTPQEQCLLKKIAQRTQDDSYGLKNLVVDISRALLAR